MSVIFSLRVRSNIIREASFKRLYQDTFDYLRKEWEQQDTCSLVPSYHSPDKKDYTSYRYPCPVDDSTVVAVKSGLKDINALVTIVHGKEKRLSYIGSINSRLDYRNGKIYWTEIVPGLRWTHENYSVLKCYDLKEGRIKSITPRQRYLSPSVDKNGKVAAVSRTTVDGKNRACTGRALKMVKNCLLFRCRAMLLLKN
ncbi:hypothetical protein NXX53_21965 [Bacteroides salyersiae]|nr:hypothetical protein [Bacteroides salyersiae]